MDKKTFRRTLILLTAQKDWDKNDSYVSFVNRFVENHETDPLEGITDFSILTRSDIEQLFQQGVTKKALLFAAKQKNQHLEVKYFLEKQGFLSHYRK